MHRIALILSIATLGAGEAGLAFKRAVDTPYPKHTGASAGDLAIGDLDGDGRKDLLFAGSQNGKPVAQWMRQTAPGVFAAATAVAGVPGLGSPCLRLADLDGDGDADLVAYGRTGTANQTAILQVFTNDGKGAYAMAADLGKELPLEDFEDVPGAWGKAGPHADNLTDAEVRGLYNFNGWSKGVLALADLDGDGDADVVAAGTKGMESGTDPAGQQIQRDWESAAVFLNQGGLRFIRLDAPGFPQASIPADPEREPARCPGGVPKVSRGFAVCADLNGDGKADLAIWGQANMGSKANAGIPETQRNGQPIAEVLLGKGDGSFTRVATCGLTPLIDGSAVAADIDRDGKPDLVVQGSTGHPKDPNGGRFLAVHRGNGDGTFAAPASTGLTPMFGGDQAVGDLDGDGDGDLDLVSGGNANDRALFIHLNDGGAWTLVDLSKMKDGIGSNGATGTAESDASAECDVAVDDLDGDGDQDVVVMGRGGSTQLLVFLNRRL